ncbi:MAG: trypsin-like peptidase domain-containing protein, partial [Moorea sp. SIO2B7]|nr:trypsin-like peptidase domain-containing protein [Moorena sp. SIO2B7]
MNELRNGIVRILNQSDKTVGTGFIVSTELIVTCAHVIKYAGAKPGSDVSCVRLVDGQKLEALVEEKYWREPANEDVAFLRVNEPFSEDFPLTLGTSANISDHSLYSYGFPAKLSRELPVRGTILGETVDGNLLVLRSTDIVEGVSGAPVIDQQTHLIVGMVSERIKPHFEKKKEKQEIILRIGIQTHKGYLQTTRPTGRLEDIAYAIPSSVLLEICSELSIEYTCPYLGLSAFTENEERFFFGRDKLVDQLVKKLLSYPEFLAVVGSSGSGKSSVVQARLFPKLQRGELLGFPQNVPIFKLRPSDKDTPEESLLAAFFGVQYSESKESGDVWARVQHYLKQHSSRSIIFIDQFEELFALFPDKQEAFTRGLYDLVKAVSDVSLIVTIRSDFYEPLQNSALGHFLPEYQENM